VGKAAWPTKTELESYLTSAGVGLGTLDTTTAPAAASDLFERACGRTFLPTAARTRYYDPPTGARGLLNLQRDLAVLTSVTYQPRGASAQALTENTDFFLEPYNRTGDDEPENGPYTHLRFDARWDIWREPLPGEYRRAVQVRGQWGYATLIPEDAWWAVLVLGAALLAPAAGNKISGGLLRSRVAGLGYDWGPRPLAFLKETHMEDCWAAIRRYRKRRL
jgi:hypothetical protein